MNMQYIDREKETVQEALKCGASAFLLIRWLFWKRKHSVGAPVGTQDDIRSLIEPEVAAYRQKLTTEFNLLNIGFADPDGTRKPIEHYFVMRPLYYLLGFNDPCKDILSQIKPYNFLGQHVGGVHRKFTSGLNNVPAVLNRAPGLLQKMCNEINFQTGDGCFCPRYVAGSSKLSNHAFGLAIDIDNPENPRIVNDPKKPDIIPLLNEVVKRKAGLNYDFGSQLVDKLDSKDVLNNPQRLLLAYRSARNASDAIREWLKENLATYETCLSEISQAKGAKPGTPAFINGQQAQMAIDGEQDLQLLKRVNQQIKLGVLESWAQTGIVNLPIELVAAFYVAFHWNPLFRWGGGDYHTSKDFMHFELQAVVYEKNNVIRPGALTPDAKPRTLEELFPADFLASFEIDTLVAEIADLAKIPVPALITSAPSIRLPR